MMGPAMKSCAGPVALAGVLLAGCAAGRDAGRDDSAGESAAARPLPLPTAPPSAARSEADPILARVKALASRRAVADAPRRRTSEAATEQFPGAGDARPVAAGPAVPSPSKPKVGPRGIEALLPSLTGGASASRAPGPAELVLEPGDELDLMVSGQPEFSGSVTVRSDGTIALPMTGDIVPAGGKTSTELAAAVGAAVSPRYVKKTPDVSVVVTRSPRLAYHVFGAVRRPGRYEMPPGGVTVLDAVIRASLAPRGGVPSVVTGGVFDAPREVLEFTPVPGARYDAVRAVAPGDARADRVIDVARAMRGGPEALERVLPGDVIVVPAAKGEWSEENILSRVRLRGAADGAALSVEGRSP